MSGIFGNLNFLSLRQVFFHFAGVKWSWEWFCDTLVVVIVNVNRSTFPSCIVNGCFCMSIFTCKLNKVRTPNFIFSVTNITPNCTWISWFNTPNHTFHVSEISMNIIGHEVNDRIVNFTIELRHSSLASFPNIATTQVV